MYQRFAMVLIAMGMAAVFIRPSFARTWTSSDGKFTLEAELVSFDGSKVELRSQQGRDVKVALERLSDADLQHLWTLVDDPQFAAAMPQPIKRFKQGMEMARPVEIRRIEKRLEELRKEIRSGSRDRNHPVAGQAKELARYLGKRLELLQSDAAFVPTLSPKSFMVGQIGVLDDDLQFSITPAAAGDEQKVSVSFFEYRHINKLPGLGNSWHVTTISRPDLMIVKAKWVNQLPQTRLDRDPKSKANQMLRAHVYLVTEARSRGAARDFVLTPFDMTEVNPMLGKD